MHSNQQPRIGRIPLALIAVSHVAAVPSVLSLSHLATQAFTLRKPIARQDAWHFDWQSESHPAWPLTCEITFGAFTVGWTRALWAYRRWQGARGFVAQISETHHIDKWARCLPPSPPGEKATATSMALTESGLLPAEQW